MAISINWITGIISVPKADMTLIQSNPTEIRELNLNTFRLTLKDLEDDEAGMPHTKTHEHNTTVTVGGVTLARVIEILDPYTITFEDGQYAVNLVGANSNVADKTNVNQVSVRSANSAGLITTTEIEQAAFQDMVHVNVTGGEAGTTYPIGTPSKPVNNLTDAKLIATYRGLDAFSVHGDLTIDEDISGYRVVGEGTTFNYSKTNIILTGGVITSNTHFEKCRVDGTQNGETFFIDCTIGVLFNMHCYLETCKLVGPVTLSNAAWTANHTTDIVHSHSSKDWYIVDFNNSPIKQVYSDFTGKIKLTNMTHVSGGVIINSTGGEIWIDSSCTAGFVTLTGISTYINDGSGQTVTIDGLVERASGSGATPQDIWTYADRTLTQSISGGGASAQEIWEYANRTLTQMITGGATAQEVWEYATRSLTDKTGFAPSTSDIWGYIGRSLDGDVAGKILGGGAGSITGIGVYAQTEDGQKIASVTDVNQLIQSYTYAITGAGGVVINEGTLISGSWSDTTTHNDVYLQIEEEIGTTYGIQVDFGFQVELGLVPGQIQFYGRYQGGALHDVEILAYNYTLAAWEFLSFEGINELESSTNDYYKPFAFNGEHVNDTNGMVQIRLQHNPHATALNSAHDLYIDKLVAVMYAVSPTLTASDVWSYHIRTLTAGTKDAEIDAIKVKTDNLPPQFRKNQAFNNFGFVMKSETNHITPLPGLSVTAERSIDGGVFAPCANAPTEIGSGAYKIDFAASDLNGNTIIFKFTATGADPVLITIITNV